MTFEPKIINALKKGLEHPEINQFACFSFNNQEGGQYKLSARIYSLDHSTGIYTFSASGNTELKIGNTSTLLGGFYTKGSQPQDLSGELEFQYSIKHYDVPHLVLELFVRKMVELMPVKVAAFAWPCHLKGEFQGTLKGKGQFGPVLF